ncbi:MAG: hypothetical protein C5B49_11710 [Bdellovibrio sp.]|nr:MAG: hypothetical protein C5B49_11710 [Bdellovibrio sp.]
MLTDEEKASTRGVRERMNFGLHLIDRKLEAEDAEANPFPFIMEKLQYSLVEVQQILASLNSHQ